MISPELRERLVQTVATAMGMPPDTLAADRWLTHAREVLDALLAEKVGDVRIGTLLYIVEMGSRDA